MNSAADVGLIAELARMRTRLLDLTANNRLLNYKHPSASSLRIVDEMPAKVLESLLAGGSFSFAALARTDSDADEKALLDTIFEPTARDAVELDTGDEADHRREKSRKKKAARERSILRAARESGINPSFDLQAAGDSQAPQHSDRRLQTLLDPDELEARLQKLHASAVTAIQETGANMLHLLFGFVEWKDGTDTKTRMAPLVLLPVRLARLELDRSTHTYPYTLAASGEVWDTNITLVEKCRREFGFVLPEIEEGQNLEQYFTAVEEVLTSAAPTWRIRRQLSLGLVSFGKILMWRDLDPDTWPERLPLLSNVLLREMLGEDVGGEAEGVMNGSVEYSIDQLPSSYGPVPPIVVPADSSQHSVLVDVQRKVNIVVQGPPGTGKSQTITNIIANAISSGKKILFVAEKKAALDVVARRLVDAGLGPFCLPLHSHTSQKREFLDDLEGRLNYQTPDLSVSELKLVQGLIDETREELSAHVARLHEPFGALGESPYTIFWRTRRIGSQLSDEVLRRLDRAEIPDALSFGAIDVARMRATLATVEAVYQRVRESDGDLSMHAWKGMARSDLNVDELDALYELARRCQDAFRDAEEARTALEVATNSLAWPATEGALSSALLRCTSLKAPDASIPDGLLSSVYHDAGVERTRDALIALQASSKRWKEVNGPWGVRGSLTREAAVALTQTLRRAIAAFGEDCTVESARGISVECRRVVVTLKDVEKLALDVCSLLNVQPELSVELGVCLLEIASSADSLSRDVLSLRSESLAAAAAGDKLAELSSRREMLTRTSQRLDKQFEPTIRPSLAELREAVESFSDSPRLLPFLFSPKYRRATSIYLRATGGKRANRAAMLSNLQILLRHESACASFSRDPHLMELFGSAAKGLNSPFENAAALLRWTSESERALRCIAEHGRSIVGSLWNASESDWRRAADLVATQHATAENARELSGDLMAVTGRLHAEEREVAGAREFSFVIERLSTWGDITHRAAAVADAAGVASFISLGAVVELLNDVSEAYAADDLLAAHKSTLDSLPRTMLLNDERTFEIEEDIENALSYLAQFPKEPVLPQDICNWLVSDEGSTRLATLQRSASCLSQILARACDLEREFVEVAAANLSEWYEGTPEACPIASRANRYARAVNDRERLVGYASLLRERARVTASAFPIACDLMDEALAANGSLADTFEFVLARTLARAVLKQNPKLEQFAGALHETRRAQFVALDEKMLSLTRKGIARQASSAPHVRGIGFGPVRDLTDEGLIKHEIGKQKRHVPIREMFRRAGGAIQSLKPCLMMGPQAVAQFLPPGLFHFDLVVMDEASQMRPEDALGAIARGEQIVVVGDPKQLGPTSFFDTQSDDDDDDIDEAAAMQAQTEKEAMESAEVLPLGASVLQKSESILLAAARRFPTRMLRWHYRSRYPELIAFSNQEFYGGDLILFPHPGSDDGPHGLNFCGVDHGIYSGRTNAKEAIAIVTAVRSHAADAPEKSLLVATMNQPQRELIDTLLQEAEKDDPSLASFRKRHDGTLEPFAVKNLENVQGDERDVVFISVTYGPDAAGALQQNFGPINKLGGERRLNVLFTRAKDRLDVFCSFDPTRLHVNEESPRGLMVLRDFLRYAKERTLAGGRFANREPDSDFEIEVAARLRGHGLEVHPQVGVAGYFLDMAVVHPDRPGCYLLAIECDGATYHSAKSARDRDRLRQGVLEGLGWSFHRIWSTDWFRNPRGEAERVHSKIANLLETERANRQ